MIVQVLGKHQAGQGGHPDMGHPEQDGVSSVPCAACSLQWKGQEILWMGEKGLNPTYLCLRDLKILPAKQNMSKDQHGSCWHLLSDGLGWDGHS